MREFIYPAKVIAEDVGFTFQFVDLPEAITCGDDMDEALANAADCLEEAFANRIAHEMEIPEASPVKRGQKLVALPAPMAAKTALYLAIKATGLPNTQIARRVGLDEKEVRRMLDPRYATKIGRIHEILAHLGARIVVRYERAA